MGPIILLSLVVSYYEVQVQSEVVLFQGSLSSAAMDLIWWYSLCVAHSMSKW